MSNDCFSSLDQFKSIEDLRKLKVNELKTILKSFGEPSGGKKEDLVLRCFVLVERAKGDSNTSSSGNSERNVTNDPPLPNTTDLTYEVIIREANGLIWKKDLRELPSVSFVQLYDYLVTKTSKYSQLDICTGGYKKLRAFQFLKKDISRLTTMQQREFYDCEGRGSCFDESGKVQVSDSIRQDRQ